jgi:hypothetical protein
MNLRQMATWGKQGPPPLANQPVPDIERSLTHLTEGAASNMLAIDAADHRDFRAKVSQLALQMRDGLTDAEKSALILGVLHEFAQYRKISEETMRDRVAGWRTLVSKLLVDLLARTGIDAGSMDAAPLVHRVASHLTTEETQGLPHPTNRLFPP